MDSSQISPYACNADNISSSHSFLDLSSGQIQTNIKYPVEAFSSEINNNSSYQSNVENIQTSNSKLLEVNTYSYNVNCAVENEKILKRKQGSDVEPISKQNQNYHQHLFPKMETSCLLQQSSSYSYPSYFWIKTKKNVWRLLMQK